MSKRLLTYVFAASLVAVLCTLTPGAAEAAQVVGATGAAPTSVAVGSATPVTVTAVITDGTLIASSVNLQRLDEAGRVIATLGTLGDTGTGGDATAGDKVFTLRVTLFETSPTAVRLRVSAAFQGKLTRVYSPVVLVNVVGTSTGITIAAPANLAYVNTSPVRVTGTVGDPAATVTVNGVPAATSAGSFTGSVPLQEGTNTVTAVAGNSNGSTTTASVQVTLDTTPPHVTITAPADQAVTTAAAVAVSGMVNDIVVGTVNDQQAQVTVNGYAAQVANRSFLVANVGLNLGANTIQVVATDRSGNVATTQITVTRVAATTPTIRVVAGSGQTGPVGTQLPQPLIASVVNALGQPVSGVPVVFRVTENSGGLVSGSAALGTFAVTTTGQGQASVPFKLGTRAGVGNNIIEATAAGYAGPAVFTESATSGTPSQIVVDTGNGQIGAVGTALPLPFIAIVTDEGHNRLSGVPVTFTVRQGGGTFASQPTVTTTSDGDGRVAATLTLGRQEGQDNNVVEATFVGNAGNPAAFLATARVPGDPAQTRITGVVLNNSNAPIAGVTMRVFQTHTGPGIPVQVTTPVVTDAAGTFTILPAPVGTFKLMADGSTASDGVYPPLEFDITTVAGQNNDVGLPIYLPNLDTVNRLCVDEVTGGTLTLPQVPGFALTILPGAATFPGGARSGCVTVTPVNGDKVPMAPGFGQQPRFVVTIQPVGTLFNPPAALSLPNVDGLLPRQVTEMYSYDHDLASFVAIGTGTVSEDGLVIRSDPGVGVLKAGWHCGGNPNPTGVAATCPTCSTCQGTNCVPDNSQTPPQTAPDDCKKQICACGSVTTVNDNSEQPPNVCQQCQSGSATDRADGSTPADANKCCYQGQSLNKFGNEPGIFISGDLIDKCPGRTTDTTKLHLVDGCSGGVPPNIQDPMTNLPYPYGLLNQAPTPFGQDLGGGGGTTIPNDAAAGPLPCNQHDLCYQTCYPGDGTAFTSSARSACDDGMKSRMDNVCSAAYPSSCPASLGVLECVSYQAQRLDCFTYSDLYWTGLRAGGGSAFNERQGQFCKCCQ